MVGEDFKFHDLRAHSGTTYEKSNWEILATSHQRSRFYILSSTGL